MGPEPYELPDERPGLHRQSSRLASQLVPAGLEACLLVLELLLLFGQLLLLLLEIGLERHRLVVLLGVLVARGRRWVEGRGDLQRTVVADTQARADQVVRLPFGRLLRGGADVLLPELEAEHRDDEWHQGREREARDHPRVAMDDSGPPRPQALVAPTSRTHERRQRGPADPVAQQSEERGQQSDRHQDGGYHGHGRGVPERGDQRDAGHAQREEGHHDGAAGEDDGAAGRCHRLRDRLADRHPVAHLILVSGDQEEGVVDAHAEADHGGKGRPGGRDCEEVADQTDGGQGDAEPDDGGDDRQTHRHQAPEHEAEDDHRCDDPDDLAGPGLVGRQCRADGAAGRGGDARVLGGVGGVQDIAGDLLRQVAGPDVHQHRREGCSTVLRQQAGGLSVAAQRVGDGVDVRLLADLLHRVLDGLLVGRVGQLPLAHVEDDRVDAVLLGREPLGEQVLRLLAAGAGQCEVVAGLGAEARDGQDHGDEHQDPGADDKEAVPGTEAPESTEEACHDAAPFCGLVA